MSDTTTLAELLNTPVVLEGLTRETQLVALPIGDLVTESVVATASERLATIAKVSLTRAKEEAQRLMTGLTQVLEGIDEVVGLLDGLTAGDEMNGEKVLEIVEARYRQLEKVYTDNVLKLAASQAPIAQGLGNLQLFFDAAGGATDFGAASGFHIYWLNQSEQELRDAPPDQDGRHPVLDLGEGDKFALLTSLDDTRVLRLHASVIVLGDPIASESQASYWALQAFNRKIPVVAGISARRFSTLTVEEVRLAKRDLCGAAKEFSYLALVGNEVLLNRPNMPQNLLASGAFAYAGVLARHANIGSVPITPDEGRIPGTPSLDRIRNWMKLEEEAPIIWLTYTTERQAESELTHANSNSAARTGLKGAITDTIAFCYLTRTIQHFILTQATGSPTNDATAKRLGNEINRKFYQLTHGSSPVLKDAEFEVVQAGATRGESGSPPKFSYKVQVKFAGSTEHFSIQLEME
jgi:hypothetical protein